MQPLDVTTGVVSITEVVRVLEVVTQFPSMFHSTTLMTQVLETAGLIVVAVVGISMKEKPSTSSLSWSFFRLHFGIMWIVMNGNDKGQY